MITREEILKELPPYQDEWVMIERDQEVKDIIFEVLDAHEHFAPYYDKIALYFYDDDLESVCNNLYNFLHREIKYKEEPETMQTTALPTGILTRGYGDCKHYSIFAGGVLSALGRLNGKKINWAYRFASYDITRKNPHHVFVVVKDGANEYWIDPTPGANDKEPAYYIDKKPKAVNMALYRNISGIGGMIDYEMTSDLMTQNVTPDMPDDLPSDIIEKINLLLAYGVIDENGNFNQDQLMYLSMQVDLDVYKTIIDAKQSLEQASQVGGLFGDVWRGIKKVTLAVPRGAFLSMVALNMFGLATKLKQAMSTYDGHKKVSDRWYSLGGDLVKIKEAIEAGAKKPKILGSSQMGAAAAAPAWVATAGAIIAAILPLVNAVLKAQAAQNVPPVEGYDTSLINFGNDIPGANAPTGEGSDIKKYLPYVLGGAAVLYLLSRPKARKAAGLSDNILPIVLIGGAVAVLALRKGGSSGNMTTAQKMAALNQWAAGTGETFPAFTDGEVNVVYSAYVDYWSKGAQPPSSWPYYSQLVAISNKYGIFQ